MINILDSTYSAHKASFYRICLGLALLLNMLVPLGRLKEFYSNEGYFSNQYILSTFGDRFSFFFFNDNLTTVYILFILQIAAVLLLIKGILPRFMLLIILVITMSFSNRDPFHLYGGHQVLFNILILSLFCELKSENRVSRLPFLAIQIQIALIYFGAVVPKLASNDWWTGQYVFSMINYPHRSYLPLLWMHEYPAVINLLTYSVLLAELSFPLLVWFNRTRMFMVSMMCCFHLGIFFTYNVVYFSPIMILLLPVFLNDKEVYQLTSSLGAFKKRILDIL